MENELKDLNKKINELRAQNDAWQKEFNHLISFRERAKALEDVGDIEKALQLHLEAITFGESNEQLNINNYAFDINRAIVLYGKMKKTEELKAFLTSQISKYSGFSDVNKWKIRLSKLKSTSKRALPTFSVSDLRIPEPSCPTKGDQIADIKMELPEFDFYHNPSSLKVIFDTKPKRHLQEIRRFRDKLNTLKSNAKIAANQGKYKKAIEIYEGIIAEEYEDADTYDKLIVLYSKLKLKDQEIDTIKRAIAFFTSLKKRQLEYVTFLAKKYGKGSIANEYINNNKTISYYGGAFELYNPQTTRLEKWNNRLDKLNA